MSPPPHLLPTEARLRDRLPPRPPTLLRRGLARWHWPASPLRASASLRTNRRPRKIANPRLHRSLKRTHPIRRIQSGRRRVRANPHQTSLGRNRLSRPRPRRQRNLLRHLRIDGHHFLPSTDRRIARKIWNLGHPGNIETSQRTEPHADHPLERGAHESIRALCSGHPPQ